LGWGIYALGLRAKPSAFFTGSSWLLLFVAAGFLARGVHGLQEAAVLPTAVERLWDLNPILPSSSAPGRFPSSLFGHNPAPSLVVYFVYVVGMGFALARRPRERPSSRERR
jgi:high-affinity iron transporter